MATDLYVSTSGSDNASGSANSPLKNISTALAKNPARIFLKKGDTWNDSIKIFNPVIIDSYGSGDLPPCLYVKSTGISVRSERVEVRNLKVRANRSLTVQSDATGISVNTSNVKLVNNKVEGFFENILLQKPLDATSYIRNILLEGNIVSGAWQPVTGKSHGLYVSGVDGLILRKNQWLNNGRNGPTSGSKRNILSHNVYISHHNSPNTLVDGDLFVGGSSHGIQLRSGGIVKNCKFDDNGIAILIGTANSEIANNVIIGGANVTSTHLLGWGIEVVRTPRCLISGNYIGYKKDGVGLGPAIKTSNNDTPFIAGDPPAVPAENPQITVENNTICEWRSTNAIEVVLDTGNFNVKNNRILEEAEKLGQYNFIPRAIKLQGGVSFVIESSNVFAYKASKIFNDNGTLKNLQTRIPFVAIPIPAWPSVPTEPPMTLKTYLTDATTKAKIVEIRNGDKINFNTGEYSLEFLPSKTVGSVRITAPTINRLEKIKPYNLTNDGVSWKPLPGPKAFKIYIYSSADGTGQPTNTFDVFFEAVA